MSARCEFLDAVYAQLRALGYESWDSANEAHGGHKFRRPGSHLCWWLRITDVGTVILTNFVGGTGSQPRSAWWPIATLAQPGFDLVAAIVAEVGPIWT